MEVGVAVSRRAGGGGGASDEAAETSLKNGRGSEKKEGEEILERGGRSRRGRQVNVSRDPGRACTAGLLWIKAGTVGWQ